MQFEQVLGVRFINVPIAETIEYIFQVRGYTVAPAAPAFANIQRDQEYRRALLEADTAIADSGFMVLLWYLLRGRRLVRNSGLRYLQTFLETAPADSRIYLILPTESAREKALCYFSGQKLKLARTDTAVAPIYQGRVSDEKLISVLNLGRPDHVIVALGGGTQEKLGLHLRDRLAYRPAIHCVGAALGFLTGDQQPIPMWIDRLYLGWLLRLICHPRRYARRFSRAFELPGLILRYGRETPSLKVESRS